MHNKYQNFTYISSIEVSDFYKHNKHNVALVVFKQNKTIGLSEAKELFGTVENYLSETGDVYVITDAEDGTFLTPEARKEFATNPFNVNRNKGNAIVFKSLAIRMLYNFYIKFNKPKFPHKSFTNVNKAMLWIAEKIAEPNDKQSKKMRLFAASY